VDTNEKNESFLNGLNDGLAYALEAHDFVIFQATVNKVLMLENRRGMMKHKHKQEHQGQQRKTPDPILVLHLLDLFYTLCSKIFSRDLNTDL
jgi:hypothetical protein